MARNFNGTDQSLRSGASAVVTYPITLACWATCTQNTLTQVALAVGDSGAASRVQIAFAGDVADDPVRAQTMTGGGTLRSATSSTSYSTNTWHHLTGVFGSASSRIIYLDGGGKETSTTSPAGTKTDWDNVLLGARDSAGSIGLWLSGNIAEAAVWNVDLTDSEIAQLAQGYSPLFVRPQALVHYVPGFGRAGAAGGEEDWVAGGVLSAANSPGISDHPRIIYPSRGQRIWVPSAAAVAPTLTAAIAHNLGSTTVTPRVTFTR